MMLAKNELPLFERPAAATGLNLYLHPSRPVSSFGSCGHHINILFFPVVYSELYRGKNSNR